MSRRLAIVASHVIQYQDPFFRLLAREPEIDLTVLYCSDAGVTTYRDADMGSTLRWDLDLLQGYGHRFLFNFARDSNRGWTRHLNPGIVPALMRGRYQMVIFMVGWGSVTAMAGIFTCLVAGIPFFLYGDSSFPPPETGFRSRLRARLLRALFRRASGFMISGVLNGEYYRQYGANPERFFLLPWAVDNQRFQQASRLTAGARQALRAELEIPADRVLFLFSAKLVPRKDPLTLLRAYQRMRNASRAAVLFVGEGELRPSLQSYAEEHGLDGVHFAGFVNQSALPKYYGLSDVFVLPSTYEPRGAVINEAMASGLPLIVTDRCGSIGDIVLDGDNAFIYPAGDESALAALMDRLTEDGALRNQMARRSGELIGGWTYARGVQGVRAAMEWNAGRDQT